MNSEIKVLIFILFLGLILYAVYYIAGKFVQGTILYIIGAIIALIFVVTALNRLGLL